MVRQFVARRKPVLAPPTGSARIVRLQRRCACGGTPGPTGECEACRRKRLSLQRRAKGEKSIGSIPPIVHDVLRGPGQPLEPGTREDMETRFGHDFSSVRIHRGAEADSAAEAVNAAAFTVGRDVVFANAFYQPHTRSGRFLLAHELAHTIQQGPTNGARPRSIGGVNDAGEAEADAAAQRVATGNTATPASFGLARTILTLAKTDCSKLKMGSCRGGVYKCGFRNTGTCAWVGPSRGGCICVGELGPKDILIPFAVLVVIAALIISLPADVIAGIGVALAAAIRWLALLLGLTAGAGLASAGGSEEGGDVSDDGEPSHEQSRSAEPKASTAPPPPPAHSTASQSDATPGSTQSPATPAHKKKTGTTHPPLKKGSGGHSYRLSVIEGLNLERVTVGKHYAVTFDPKGPNQRFVILQATNKVTKGSDTTVDFVSLFECSRAEKQCNSGGNFFSVTHPFHPSEGRAERGKVHSEK
jgi:hypothetical protein